MTRKQNFTLLGLPIKALTKPLISVAPKHRGYRKRPHKYISPLFDSRGHPDPHGNWEAMLPEVKAGHLIHKQKHADPPLTETDHNLGVEYNEKMHGAMLCDELDVSHLTSSQQITLTALIKQYWRVFSKEGITTPVKDYECEIDTGDAKPIACPNATFGPRELPIIEKAIAKLLALGHIEQIYDGE